MRSGAVEGELDFRPRRLAAYLEHRVCEEIDWTRSRTRINHEIAASTEFETVGGIVAEIVGRQTGTLVSLADVYGPPITVGVEFRPTVIAVDSAVIPLRRDCRAVN